MLMIELWIVGWLNTSWPATGGVDDLASFAPDSHSLLEFRSVAHLYYYYYHYRRSHTLLFAPKVHRLENGQSALGSLPTREEPCK